MNVKVTIDHQVCYVYSWFSSSRNLVVSGAYLDMLVGVKSDGVFSGVDTVCVIWDGRSKRRLLCGEGYNKLFSHKFVPLLWLREAGPNLEIGWISSSRAASLYLARAVRFSGGER